MEVLTPSVATAEPSSQALRMLAFEMKLPNFKEGSYGVVFFSSDGRATKVFKRRINDPKTHTQSVFESEVEAYELASTNNELRKYIPQFYGRASILGIVNYLGTDISNEFELDCAYQMQKVSGDFIKCRVSDASQEIAQLFISSGIKHISDTSLVLDEGNNIRYVIDFAAQKYVPGFNPF